MLNSLFSLKRLFRFVTAFLIWVSFIGVHVFAIAQETQEESKMEESFSGFDDEDSVIEEALLNFDDDESAKDEKINFSEFDVDNNIQQSDKTKEMTGNVDWNTFFGYTGISISYSFVQEPPEKIQILTGEV
jgi:hypothetical protein